MSASPGARPPQQHPLSVTFEKVLAPRAAPRGGKAAIAAAEAAVVAVSGPQQLLFELIVFRLEIHILF